MSEKPLKFAVVREDPHVELALLERFACRRPLLVASGGCTMLELKAERADLTITGFDFNPTQLQHVRDKQEAVARGELAALNLDDDARDGLNQRGEFEGLFHIWRTFLSEFVATEAELLAYFETMNDAERHATLERWMASPYWARSFEVVMHHPLLDTMFGPEATQHALPGSYPRYFQRVFERGLARADAPNNPFLQHILLGRYLPGSEHAHITAARHLELDLIEGGLLDVPHIERFDFVQLSNIFDWCDDTLIQQWSMYLSELEEGSVIVIRQLNNTRDLRPFFTPHFHFQEELSHKLLAQDRSLFYNKLEIGVRTT